MYFEIGEEVVCVKRPDVSTEGNYHVDTLSVGKIYIVKGVKLIPPGKFNKLGNPLPSGEYLFVGITVILNNKEKPLYHHESNFAKIIQQKTEKKITEKNIA